MLPVRIIAIKLKSNHEPDAIVTKNVEISPCGAFRGER